MKAFTIQELFIVVMITAILVVSFAGGCGACDVPDESTRALQASGYTDIQLHGHSYLSCSKGDQSSMKFTAKNPVGTKVEGVICCGGTLSFKGCTVRF